MHRVIKARLFEVQGDQEEFADIIGERGEIHLTDGDNWFSPECGQSVTFIKKRITKKDGVITITTGMGNTFRFKAIAPEVIAKELQGKIERAKTELAKMETELLKYT